MDWIQGIIDAAWNQLADLYAWLAALFDRAFELLWTLASGLASWAVAQLPPDVAQMFNGQWWSYFSQWFDIVSWFIPVNQIIVILVGTMTIVGAIRLGRWILKLIPTISG